MILRYERYLWYRRLTSTEWVVTSDVFFISILFDERYIWYRRLTSTVCVNFFFILNIYSIFCRRNATEKKSFVESWLFQFLWFYCFPLMPTVTRNAMLWSESKTTEFTLTVHNVYRHKKGRISRFIGERNTEYPVYRNKPLYLENQGFGNPILALRKQTKTLPCGSVR